MTQSSISRRGMPSRVVLRRMEPPVQLSRNQSRAYMIWIQLCATCDIICERFSHAALRLHLCGNAASSRGSKMSRLMVTIFKFKVIEARRQENCNEDCTQRSKIRLISSGPCP